MVGATGVRYYLGIGAGAACDPYKTFPLKAYHSAVLRAMIDRDKNHPCVVRSRWSAARTTIQGILPPARWT